MFGLGDEFIYSECGGCGTLHLETEIEDWGRYYPAKSYYSMDEGQIAGPLADRRPTLTRRTVAQTVLKVPFPDWVYRLDRRLPFGRWCRNLGLTLESRILDVGSGGGSLVRQLATVGFTNLVGVDPFIAGSVTHPDGVRLVKGELADLDEFFDFVMFHHSLEHVPDRAKLSRMLRGSLLRVASVWSGSRSQTLGPGITTAATGWSSTLHVIGGSCPGRRCIIWLFRPISRCSTCGTTPMGSSCGEARNTAVGCFSTPRRRRCLPRPS